MSRFQPIAAVIENRTEKTAAGDYYCASNYDDPTQEDRETLVDGLIQLVQKERDSL